MSQKTAVLSPDGLYRYSLARQWLDGQGTLAFVMLNPSTADHRQDDPTITRCIRFAQTWGFNRLEVVNLFALRATDPLELRKAADPVGPENDHHLTRVAEQADRIVCGWGSDKFARARARHVQELLADYELTCLSQNQDGSPGHPLFLKRSLAPRPFQVVSKRV